MERAHRGAGPGTYRRPIQDGEGIEGVGPKTIQEGHTRRRGPQRGSGPGPYRRAIQDGEGPEGVGPRPGPHRRAIQDGEGTEGVVPRTIQEDHTRRSGHRGGRVQDHTGGPYKTERGRREGRRRRRRRRRRRMKTRTLGFQVTVLTLDVGCSLCSRDQLRRNRHPRRRHQHRQQRRLRAFTRCHYKPIGGRSSSLSTAGFASRTTARLRQVWAR